MTWNCNRRCQLVDGSRCRCHMMWKSLLAFLVAHNFLIFLSISIRFYPFLSISGLGHHAPWHLSFRGLRSSRRPCTRWRAGTTGGTACAKRCWSCGRSFWRKGPGRAWMPWRSGWSPMWRTRSWLLSNIVVQCEAPKIAKLVNITPITMVYGTYNYSNLDVENVNGEWWCSRFMDDFLDYFCWMPTSTADNLWISIVQACQIHAIIAVDRDKIRDRAPGGNNLPIPGYQQTMLKYLGIYSGYLRNYWNYYSQLIFIDAIWVFGNSFVGSGC